MLVVNGDDDQNAEVVVLGKYRLLMVEPDNKYEIHDPSVSYLLSEHSIIDINSSSVGKRQLVAPHNDRLLIALTKPSELVLLPNLLEV